MTTKLRYSRLLDPDALDDTPAAVDDAEMIGDVACGLLDRGLADRPGALRLVGVGVWASRPTGSSPSTSRRVGPMLEALFWGLVTAGSLWVGAALAAYVRPSQRMIGLAMAFGAGALIAAVAYELVIDAFETDLRLASSGSPAAV